MPNSSYYILYFAILFVELQVDIRRSRAFEMMMKRVGDSFNEISVIVRERECVCVV